MNLHLHKHRFEIFLVSQVAILFGSLFVPIQLFDTLSPFLFYLNIVAGSLFIGNHRKGSFKIILLVLVFIGSVFALAAIYKENKEIFNYLKIIVLFLFYIVVTYNTIKQIWVARLVDKNVILGLISGFISLGFVGFFICISVEIIHPGSFQGLEILNNSANSVTERLMYYSYITLMTIGFGDIVPITLMAQKATILIGLVGQFYLVIITAIIVGKFVNQFNSNQKNKGINEG